jgi:hypothetical protein|nr:MAG TPA: Lipopolysaccharide assembly protein A domain [Caudoviricetes sp.]
MGFREKSMPHNENHLRKERKMNPIIFALWIVGGAMFGAIISSVIDWLNLRRAERTIESLTVDLDSLGEDYALVKAELTSLQRRDARLSALVDHCKIRVDEYGFVLSDN